MDEYKKKTNTGDDVFVRIHPQNSDDPTFSPNPTVVLMGWLGSKHKHVAKYAAIWETMGYNTVQTVAPLSVIFPMTQRTTAIYLLSIIRILGSDDRLTNGGVIFQLFSNGGAIVAPHLSIMFNAIQHPPQLDGTNNANINNNTMANDKPVTLKRHASYLDSIKADDRVVITKVRQAHAALLFDSAPVYMHPHLGYTAINEGLGLSGTMFAYIVAFFFTLLCHIQGAFIGNMPKEFWDDITNANYVCPELYIYSKMDHLLDIPTLESMIEHRKQKGREVRVYCVDDAPHVAIFRKYPDTYLQTLHAANEWGVNAWRKRNSLKAWDAANQS